jgi:hypothetical protein
MTILKIYLDGTKYFEIDDIEKINIKNHLPLSKQNQIYQFYIYSRSERGHYRPLDSSRYLIYKDSEGIRYLYQYKEDKLSKIEDMGLLEYPTTKIFMRTAKNLHIYNISIINHLSNRSIEEFYKYVLSEFSLSKEELLYQLFKKYNLEIISFDREEYNQIIDMLFHVTHMKKKDFIYYFRKYMNLRFPFLSKIYGKNSES